MWSVARRIAGVAALTGALYASGAWDARAQEGFFATEADGCDACYALVVRREGAPAEADTLTEHLERRGFDVTPLAEPPAYRLIHHVNRLFRVLGADPKARLVFYYAGESVTRGRAQYLTAADTGTHGEDAPGMDALEIGHVAHLARESAAGSVLIVFDARLPGAATLPHRLAVQPEPGQKQRLVVATGDRSAAGREMVAEIAGLLAVDAAVPLGAVQAALNWTGISGYLPKDALAQAQTVGLPTTGFPITGVRGAGLRLPDLQNAVGPRLERVPPADPRALIAACDRLAGHPKDLASRGGSGTVSDPASAMAACKGAIVEAPQELRFAYQYGRALQAAKRLEAAQRWLERAAGGHAPAQFDLAMMMGNADPARAVALIKRSATALFWPAVEWLVTNSLKYPDSGLLSAREVQDLLAKATPEQPEAAMMLGGILERQQPASETVLKKALDYYRIALKGRVGGAKEAVLRLEKALIPKDPVGACDKLLSFDVVERLSFLDLPKHMSAKQELRSRRVLLLRDVDTAAAVKQCDPLFPRDRIRRGDTSWITAHGKEIPISLWVRYAFLLQVMDSEKVGDPGITRTYTFIMKAASDAGDPAGMYLQGLYEFKFVSKDPYLVGVVERLFERAYRGGIREAGYYVARLHVMPAFAVSEHIHQDARKAVQILESLMPSPAAAKELIKIHDGGYKTVPRRYRDPSRARFLKSQL